MRVGSHGLTSITFHAQGSWSNSVKLSKLPFALFYFDYAVSVLVTATLMALTLGDPSVAPKTGQGFLHTMTGGRLGFQQAGLAFAAGVVFNAANMLLVAAIDMVGLAVAFPCSIGLALVLGTVVTYAVQPKGGCCNALVQRLGTLLNNHPMPFMPMTGDPALLFVGVALALLAVVADGLAHRALQQSTPADTATAKAPLIVNDAEAGKAAPATAPKRHSVTKGLVVCVAAGLLMGSWSPLTAASMSGSKALTPYGCFWFYTVGVVVSTVPFNYVFMRWPPVGDACRMSDYWSVPWAGHLPGLLGGAVWAVGTLFNLVGGRAVGFATSYAIGQSSPMVAALWGIWYVRGYRVTCAEVVQGLWSDPTVCRFGELKGAPTAARVFMGTMFVCYIAAIACIALSN